MKSQCKWWIGLAVLASCLGLLLLICHRPPSFSLGQPLARGQVTPQVAFSGDKAMLLAPDGSLWIWGGSQSQMAGQMLTPTTASTPVRISGKSEWGRIAASQIRIIGIKTDGSLFDWGLYDGQMAVVHSPNVTPPRQIGQDRDWADICVGVNHCLALKKDNSLWAWGQNDHGQVGDGSIRGSSAPVMISSDRNWKAIASGSFNSFALRNDGTIWGWGMDMMWQGTNDMLVPQRLNADTDWIAIAAGGFHLLALKANGTLWINGRNAHVMAADDAIFAGGNKMAQVGRDSDWRSIICGSICFFAQKADGNWWGAGRNLEGQLGLRLSRNPPGARPVISSPIRLPFTFEPWAFASGDKTTVLLAQDGTLWSWGERLGFTERNTLFKRAKDAISPFMSRVPGFGTLFQKQPIPMDEAPHKVWELPVEVKKSLNNDRNDATHEPGRRGF